MIEKLCSALVLFLMVFVSTSSAQNKIIINIETDTTEWAPIAFLSLIPDFNHLNTISNSQIIEQSGINKRGIYEFSTKYLPEGEHLYRIHFSKKGDPPASLIIGGRDHNHIFLFASRNSGVQIEVGQGKNLINDIHFSGYITNMSMHYLNDKMESIDSIDRMGTYVNRELALQTIYSDIKSFADTCHLPLLSLYALYNTDYEKDYDQNPGFYRRYLRKWRSEKSLYFRVFRKTLRDEGNHVRVFVFTAILLPALLILVFFFLWKRNTEKKKHPLADLTIQERKILNLMRKGKSNKEIAEECAVSLSTVKTHVNNIYSKLDIKSRKEIMNLQDISD